MDEQNNEQNFELELRGPWNHGFDRDSVTANSGSAKYASLVRTPRDQTRSFTTSGSSESAYPIRGNGRGYSRTGSQTSNIDSWRRAAQAVLIRDTKWDHIRLVLKFNCLDRTTAIEVLSTRPRDLLDRWLASLYESRTRNHYCDTNKCAAQDIVDMVNQRQPLPPWDGEWLFTWMESFTNLTMIAQRLDCSIRLIWCCIPSERWMSMALGFEDDEALNFLKTIESFSERCGQHIRNLESPQKKKDWDLLAEKLRDRHPLAFWIISSRTIFCDPSRSVDALDFLIEPAKQVAEQSHNIIPMLKRLSILSTRSEYAIARTTAWCWSISTEFQFLQRIESYPSNILANIITNYVCNLFSRVTSTRDLNPNSSNVKGITAYWSGLFNDVVECLIADSDQSQYFTTLAWDLIHQKNINAATAIGAALEHVLGQSFLPSQGLTMISPENNFAGAQEYMDHNQVCLPHLSIFRLQPPGTEALRVWSMSQQYLGPREEGVRQGVEQMKQGSTVGRYSFHPTPNLPSSKHSRTTGQLKRSAPNDPKLDDRSTKRVLMPSPLSSEIINQGQGNAHSTPTVPKCWPKVSERTSDIDETQRNLHATRPHSEGESSTALCREECGSIMPNHRLPEIHSQACQVEEQADHSPTIQRDSTVRAELPLPSALLQNRNQNPRPCLPCKMWGTECNGINPCVNCEKFSLLCEYRKHMKMPKRQCLKCRKGSKTDERQLCPECRSLVHDMENKSSSNTTNYPVNDISLLDSENPLPISLGRIPSVTTRSESRNRSLALSTPPLSHQGFIVSRERSSPEIGSQAHRVHEQADHSPTTQRDLTLQYRLRRGQACLMCKGKRRRCDGRRPCCGFCEKSSLVCEYPKEKRVHCSRCQKRLQVDNESQFCHECSLLQDRNSENPPLIPIGSTLLVMPTKEQCMALTAEHCRKIQEFQDPKGWRVYKDWELKFQPDLIRWYMTGSSFSDIASAMEPELQMSRTTYYNRFGDWLFPVDPIERGRRIPQLYALVSETPLSTSSIAPQESRARTVFRIAELLNGETSPPTSPRRVGLEDEEILEEIDWMDLDRTKPPTATSKLSSLPRQGQERGQGVPSTASSDSPTLNMLSLSELFSSPDPTEVRGENVTMGFQRSGFYTKSPTLSQSGIDSGKEFIPRQLREEISNASSKLPQQYVHGSPVEEDFHKENVERLETGDTGLRGASDRLTVTVKKTARDMLGNGENVETTGTNATNTLGTTPDIVTRRSPKRDSSLAPVTSLGQNARLHVPKGGLFETPKPSPDRVTRSVRKRLRKRVQTN